MIQPSNIHLFLEFCWRKVIGEDSLPVQTFNNLEVADNFLAGQKNVEVVRKLGGSM